MAVAPKSMSEWTASDRIAKEPVTAPAMNLAAARRALAASETSATLCLSGITPRPLLQAVSDSRFPQTRKPGSDPIVQLPGEEDTRILIIRAPGANGPPLRERITKGKSLRLA